MEMTRNMTATAETLAKEIISGATMVEPKTSADYVAVMDWMRHHGARPASSGDGYTAYFFRGAVVELRLP